MEARSREKSEGWFEKIGKKWLKNQNIVLYQFVQNVIMGILIVNIVKIKALWSMNLSGMLKNL